jgi:hypothetical protein
MATHGNALAGSLAASLQALEIGKLVAGERAALAAGREVLYDGASHSLVVSRLARNAACRFSHECWRIGAAAGLALRDALTIGGAGACLFVPGSAFVARLVCAACSFTEERWQLREALAGRVLPCPRCGLSRSVRGFDLVERVAAEALPRALLERPLTERGLRAGELFGVEGDGEAHYFVLDGVAAVPGGATVLVAGLGNIGSFLAPLVARIPGVARVLLCDPDVYEPDQLASQDMEARSGGRGKAEVQAERLRRIRPGLCVEAFAAPVEQLPHGRLAGAIVASCLDSRAARLRLAARAWQVGSPFVDAAVGGGASRLVRTSAYLPEAGAACFECAFDAADYAALEQTAPCAGAAAA